MVKSAVIHYFTCRCITWYLALFSFLCLLGIFLDGQHNFESGAPSTSTYSYASNEPEVPTETRARKPPVSKALNQSVVAILKPLNTI
jgi:hypothetical protein